MRRQHEYFQLAQKVAGRVTIDPSGHRHAILQAVLRDGSAKFIHLPVPGNRGGSGPRERPRGLECSEQIRHAITLADLPEENDAGTCRVCCSGSGNIAWPGNAIEIETAWHEVYLSRASEKSPRCSAISNGFSGEEETALAAVFRRGSRATQVHTRQRPGPPSAWPHAAFTLSPPQTRQVLSNLPYVQSKLAINGVPSTGSCVYVRK